MGVSRREQGGGGRGCAQVDGFETHARAGLAGEEMCRGGGGGVG